MTGKRKRHGAEFKARVALEARRGALTAAQLAAKHGVHQTMVGGWWKQAVDGLAAVFSGKEAAQDAARLSEAEVEELHAKIASTSAHGRRCRTRRSHLVCAPSTGCGRICCATWW